MGKKQTRRVSHRAVQYINNCPLEDYGKLNCQWLADQLNINSSYLSRAFKEDQNCLLKDYIISRKMDKSRELVETTKMPVKEIAELMDYASTSYFIRLFCQHIGFTPGEYRENWKTWQSNLNPAAADTGQVEEQEEPLGQIIKNRIIKYLKGKFQSIFF